MDEHLTELTFTRVQIATSVLVGPSNYKQVVADDTSLLEEIKLQIREYQILKIACLPCSKITKKMLSQMRLYN
jgi:hypothetical protein